MIYVLVKTAHIVAMIVWMSGMLVAALALLHSADGVRNAARTWDRAVTTPAMILTWALGLGIAAAYGWFGAGWLWAKIALVIVLSGFHGALSGRLRRAAQAGETRSDPFARASLGLGLLLLLAIVFLVQAKPF